MERAESKSDEPQIEVEDPRSFIGLYDPVKDIASKFDFYIKIVIAIFVVAMVTMLISVGTLTIDSFHFNSATYREYSEKIETNDTLLKAVKQNQELILKNQKAIEGLTDKLK